MVLSEMWNVWMIYICIYNTECVILTSVFYLSYTAENQKCRRKETWERLQRRHADRRATVKHTEKSVWVPPTTEISDQFHRPATRPNRLPLTSESEFPAKNVPYELPSPTAVSLDGGGEEVTSELSGACKSSSAPHLIKSTQTLPHRTKYTGGSKVFSEVVRTC